MSRLNRNKIEQFLQWEGGQRLFNFAYSIGAAIVILGALFKILHMSGGNELLMIGMGTEVLMFILTAFDRPPKEYKWEEVFPQLAKEEKEEADMSGEEFLENLSDEEKTDVAGNVPQQQVIIAGGGGGYVGNGEAVVVGAPGTDIPAGGIVGGGVPVAAGAGMVGGVVGGGQALTSDDAQALSDTIRRMATAAEQLEAFAEMTTVTRDFMTKMAAISDQLTKLNDTTTALNGVSQVLLESYKTITENSTDISRSASGYVKEMEALNRNVGGLNTIYEIQLKSVSSQLDAIDRVNRGIKDIRDMYERSASQSSRYCEETEKMARYMQQLNHVYENMIHAMTVNMYHPAAGMPIQPERPAED